MKRGESTLLAVPITVFKVVACLSFFIISMKTVFRNRQHLMEKGSCFTFSQVELSKGTLHYMKQNAKSDKLFTLNSRVLERVKAWRNLVSGGKINL